ncbi:hypothetical protein [uncultured Desulfuromusa sp.]|uniref:hypothetical protein n=1 Tax=uncultured Desulfuromusa sp. TaxID=219183 RepID=UPI002AA9424C|nr:hypothetical protein [uncultured Desulfuromusa sp.]
MIRITDSKENEKQNHLYEEISVKRCNHQQQQKSGGREDIPRQSRSVLAHCDAKKSNLPQSPFPL